MDPVVGICELISIQGRRCIACEVLRVAGLRGVRVAVVREEHEPIRRTDRIFVRSCHGSDRDPSNPFAADSNGQTNGEKTVFRCFKTK